MIRLRGGTAKDAEDAKGIAVKFTTSHSLRQ
jgi:hypothetical protein